MNKKSLFIIGAIIVIAVIALIVSREATPPKAETPAPVATSTVSVATTTPTTTPAVKAVEAKPVQPTPVQIQNPDAAQLFALTNADRKSNSVAPLTYSLLLQQAAQDRADEIASGGQFSHYTDSNTYRFRYWLDSVGYPWKYGGENLAEGFSTMQDAETAFMASPTHRKNILLDGYTQTGIAFSKGVCQDAATCGAQFGQETMFVVVIFASR